MGKQIVFCTFFVGLQGVVKNKSKVMGSGASMVSLRHESECVKAVRVGKKMGNFGYRRYIEERNQLLGTCHVVFANG